MTDTLHAHAAQGGCNTEVESALWMEESSKNKEPRGCAYEEGPEVLSPTAAYSSWVGSCSGRDNDPSILSQVELTRPSMALCSLQVHSQETPFSGKSRHPGHLPKQGASALSIQTRPKGVLFLCSPRDVQGLRVLLIVRR